MKDVEELNPRELHATEAPTSGSFRRGDRIWHLEPTHDGPVGWVCVQSGNFEDDSEPDPEFTAFGD